MNREFPHSNMAQGARQGQPLDVPYMQFINCGPQQLWICGNTVNMAGMCWWEDLFSTWHPGSKDKKEGSGSKYLLQGHPHVRCIPPPKNSTISPKHDSLGTKISTHESLKDIQDSKYSNLLLKYYCIPLMMKPCLLGFSCFLNSMLLIWRSLYWLALSWKTFSSGDSATSQNFCMSDPLCPWIVENEIFYIFVDAASWALL